MKHLLNGSIIGGNRFYINHLLSYNLLVLDYYNPYCQLKYYIALGGNEPNCRLAPNYLHYLAYLVNI